VKYWIATAIILAAAVLSARAQAPPAASGDLDVVQVRPNFYMIAGAGANIAVQVGPIGAIVVDTGSQQHADKVVAAVKRLTDGSIRYIIDTSADKDHAGGNETVAKAGKTILGNQGSAGFSEDVYTNGGAASVLAHENVLKSMSAPAGGEHAVHAALWPTKTYTGRGYPMYLNGDAVQVIHMPAAHSDGDSVVFFHRADVIVTGDILDTTRFPAIDIARGGSIQGEIDALNRIVEMTVPPVPLAFQEDRTYVVPGHGFVCDYYPLQRQRSTHRILGSGIGTRWRPVDYADQRGGRSPVPARAVHHRAAVQEGSRRREMGSHAVFGPMNLHAKNYDALTQSTLSSQRIRWLPLCGLCGECRP